MPIMPPMSHRDTQESSAFYRLSEAARLLGVNVDTLRRWVDAGKVLSWRTPGGERRIPVDEVTRLLSVAKPTAEDAS